MEKILIPLLQKRIDHLSSWLKINGQNCTTEQLHLNKDSKERVYWKYGYLMALIDIRNIVRKEK